MLEILLAIYGLTVIINILVFRQDAKKHKEWTNAYAVKAILLSLLGPVVSIFLVWFAFTESD